MFPTLPAKSMPNLFENNVEDEESRQDKEEESEARTVPVPKADDESFQSFYETKSMETLTAAKVSVSVDDFDHIFLESEDMWVSSACLTPKHLLSHVWEVKLPTKWNNQNNKDVYKELKVILNA